MPETAIAAVCLLHERSVAEIVAKLGPRELERGNKSASTTLRALPRLGAPRPARDAQRQFS